MKHVVVAAVTQPSYDGGFVFCACGKRFGLYHEDELMRHIKEGNSEGN